MSYKIFPAMTLEFKTGTIIMPLIEEKKGVSYPNKRCVRCVNVAPATPLYIRPGPGIENNKVPLQFSRDQEF
jgi:hypothetical protein